MENHSSPERGSGRRVFTAAVAALAATATVLPGSPAHAAADSGKPATWNVQGSASRWAAVGKLAAGRHVVALQEVSATPPAGAEREQKLGPNLSGWKWKVGSSTRHYTRYLYILRHSSKNLGIVTDWAPATTGVVEVPGPYRALLCVKDVANSTLFCSVHASANGGGDAVKLVSTAAAYASQNKMKSWAVLGDFNRAPAKLRQDPKFPVGAKVYAPNQATQRSGGTLDYLVSDVSSTKWKAKVLVSKDSDHWPVQW
ncbi:endonuclease/exonuclease/phosphatase family protein [Streptomyces sp. NPDC001678]|uniref:endonuclease/exonuclease/phosphatase family protein n=1 Tax=Streptomyces sp. NPDC001678 TaxID=3364599 RepID=UPI00369D33C6